MNYEKMIALREAKESAEHAYKEAITVTIREHNVCNTKGSLKKSISFKLAVELNPDIEEVANAKKAAAKEFNKVKKQLEAVEADRVEQAKVTRETELTAMYKMISEIHAHVLSGNPVSKEVAEKLVAVVPDSSPTPFIDSHLDSLEGIELVEHVCSHNAIKVKEEPSPEPEMTFAEKLEIQKKEREANRAKRLKKQQEERERLDKLQAELNAKHEPEPELAFETNDTPCSDKVDKVEQPKPQPKIEEPELGYDDDIDWFPGDVEPVLQPKPQPQPKVKSQVGKGGNAKLVEQVESAIDDVLNMTSLLSKDDDDNKMCPEYVDAFEQFKAITIFSDISKLNVHKYYSDNTRKFCDEINKLDCHDTKQLLKAKLLLSYRALYAVKTLNSEEVLWDMLYKDITNTLYKEFEYDYLDTIIKDYNKIYGYTGNMINISSYNIARGIEE